jgi:hypothetical protein
MKEPLHIEFLQEYGLKIGQFPTDLQLVVEEYADIARSIRESQPTKQGIEVDWNAIPFDDARRFLDNAIFPALFGRKTLRQLLTIEQQGFYAKGTHNLFGPTAFVLWAAENEYVTVPPSIYQAVNLPDIGTYTGTWTSDFVFGENNGHADELQKADENITVQLIQYVKGNPGEFSSQTPKNQNVFECAEANGNSRVYQNFVWTFTDIYDSNENGGFKASNWVYVGITEKDITLELSFRPGNYKTSLFAEMTMTDSNGGHAEYSFLIDEEKAKIAILSAKVDGKKTSIYKPTGECDKEIDLKELNMGFINRLLEFQASIHTNVTNEVEKLKMELSEPTNADPSKRYMEDKELREYFETIYMDSKNHHYVVLSLNTAKLAEDGVRVNDLKTDKTLFKLSYINDMELRKRAYRQRYDRLFAHLRGKGHNNLMAFPITDIRNWNDSKYLFRLYLERQGVL